MARVPEVQSRNVITQFAPTPIDERSAVESAWGSLARAAGQIEEASRPLREKAGQEAGQKAVTRDEDGNIVVEKPGFLGVVDPTYAAARQNAAQAAYLAKVETDLQEELSALREKFPVDAAGFNRAAEGLTARFRDQSPGEFSADVFRMASSEANRVSRGIQATAERVELRKQEGALLASIGNKEDQMLALARQGGTDTPDFLELAAAYRDQVGLLAANPLFGFSAEEASLRIGNLMDRASLEASSRDVLGVYGAKGEAAALEYARGLADSFPNMTDPQREEWVSDQRMLINEREAARNKAEAGLKRINARRIDDAVATLAAGNDASSLLNDRHIFDGFNEAEVMLAREELSAAKRAGQALKSLNGADPAKRAEVLNSFVVEGPGAALTARYKASLEVEAGQIARRLDKDPVAQVAASSPELLDDMSAALQKDDPAAFRDAADALLEEQARLGAFNPRILSASHRKAIVADLVGEEDDPERVSNLKDGVVRLSQIAGVHFPRLMAELAEEDSFPAAAYGVGLMDGNERAQFLLAKAAAEDPKVLRENVSRLGTGAVDTMRDELAKAARPMVESLAASGASQTYIAKVTDSMEALASQFAVEEGKVGGAARKAFKAMFGEYHFEGSYRLPPGRDPDRTRLGIEEIMDRLQADDFIVPNPDRRMTPEAAGRSYVSHLRSQGQWVTNRDETGLILFNGAGEPVMERPRPGEAPRAFEITFDQFEALAVSQEQQRARRERPQAVR